MSTASFPLVKGHWLLGSARELQRAVHLFPAETGWRHGGTAAFRMPGKRWLAIADADHARHILVTRHERWTRSFHYRNGRAILGRGLLSTDGEVWLKRRRQILPAFRPDHLKQVVPGTVEAATALLDRWEQGRRAGQPVTAGSDMLGLTLAVMGRVLLSTDIGPDRAVRFGAALREGLPLLRRRNTAFLKAPLWLPTPRNRRLRAMAGVLDGFIDREIATRRADPEGDGTDMLSVLLRARDPETGDPLSDDALRDETKTLFLAGFETTSNALAWTLHLLARHPEAAAAWQEEIDRVLGGRAPAWEDLERLPYGLQVIQESMRIYPPVYNVARECVAEDRLGEVAVAPGTIALISVLGIHRSPAWWPEPERFRPERFAAAADWHRHAFLPFATGKHVCIGNSFALTEMLVALALIGQRYRLSPADPTPVGMTAAITLAPDREILLHLEPRS